MTAPSFASIDGRIVPIAEATVPLADDGLWRGDGVFETMRLYRGKPFALGEHLDRLEHSAKAIELDFDRAALEAEIEALLGGLDAPDAQLRVVATRAGRRVLTVEALPDWADAIAVATVTYQPSVILDGVKSLSYAANMQATRIARSRGADEAILVRPDGVVLEAPTACVFWVSADGTLRTPELGVGVLESITRARIVDALEVKQGAWPVEYLHAATEAFLASSTREVQPISAIDGRELSAAPGPRTAEAIEAFARVRDAELSAS